MKSLVAILVVITLAWASLFITIFHQTGQLKQLLNQNTTIIKQQKQTIDILSGRISDLQNHLDCLFNLAQNPNHANAFITNPNPCMISALPRPTDSPAKTPTPGTAQNPPTSTRQGSGTNNEQPAPAPSPQRPLFCGLTLGLVGC